MTLLVVTQNACGTSILVEGQHNLRVLGGFFLKQKPIGFSFSLEIREYIMKFSRKKCPCKILMRIFTLLN